MSHQKKRGTKRNATDLLTTTNQQDTSNPRPSKRQRTSNERAEATFQALLTMSLSEVNALPEALRNQALALRAERNITNPTNDRNNNPLNHHTNNNNNSYSMPSNSKPVLSHHETLMELSSDDESDEEDDDDDDDDEEDTDHYESPNTNNRHKRRPSNPQQTHHNPSYNYNPQHNRNQPRYNHNDSFNARVPLRAPPAIPVPSQVLAHRNRSSVISQPRPKPQIVHPSQTYLDPDSSDIRVPPPLPPRYINMQDLMGKKRERRTCCGCSGCVWLIAVILLGLPFFMAIPLIVNPPTSYGNNYCDTNADWIRAYSNYNCIACPLRAKYCMKGQAWCEDRSYWVDPDKNECVKRQYLTQVTREYSKIWEGIMGSQSVHEWKQWVEKWEQPSFKQMIRNSGDAIEKWRRVQEWKKWFKRLKQLSFEEFCKEYEMEVMVSFFVFTWYLPMFRCLIVFFWTRMILSTVDGGEDQLITICLRLLSYFSPILFSYHIWNKIETLFTHKSG